MIKRLSAIWESASYLGTLTVKQAPLKRNIVLTNRLAMVVALFPILYVAFIGPDNILGALYAIAFSVALLSILLLNYHGFFNISRLILSTIVPIGVSFVSVWTKSTSDVLHDFNFISPRIAILGGSVIPLMLFGMKEKLALFFSCILYFIALYQFDNIHNYYGVGYYQSGLSMNSYEYLNFSFVVNLLIIIFTTLVLKWEIQRSQKINADLLYDLEQQNLEVNAQAEELHASQERLTIAMDIISKQKHALEDLNQNLLQNIKEKDSSLIKANRELAGHNERLKQFSYGISHNLRAPVARVLGLAELLKLDFSEDLLSMLTDCTRELDDVVKDFNKVIDLGNDIYSIKEKVNLEEEWLKVKSFLASSLGQIENAEIDYDFSWCPVVFSIRPLINNILFNLVSNAIKFRSPDKKLKISITSNEDNNSAFLIVRDNGVGFDEEEVKKDMFKMYKRFHTHVTGKGLGLHLVKIQVDILSGTIQVNSKRKIGTTFTIILPKATELDFQLCFENESSTLYYNALINALGIRWKKDAEANELKETYLKCLEITRAYHTSSWIWEQNERTTINEENTAWVMEHIMPQAIRNGLKKVAIIPGSKMVNTGLSIEKIRASANEIGYDANLFTSLEDGVSWLGR